MKFDRPATHSVPSPQRVPFLRVLFFAMLAMAVTSDARPAAAQVVQAVEVLKTGRFEQPYRYSPADPWTRTLATNIQTGHFGKFYNCDGEEAKRNSPWITWKSHCERDLPKKVCCLDRWRCQIQETKQRIADGACCPPSPCSGDCAAGCAGDSQGCQTCTSCQVCQSAKEVTTFAQVERAPVPHAVESSSFASPRVAAKLEDLGTRR